MTSNTIIIATATTTDFSLGPLLAHPRLPNVIRAQAERLSGTRQIEFLACRVLLADLLAEHCAIAHLPAIEMGPNSRPQFSRTDLPHFNISHSRQNIAVALASTGAIGLDIETHRLHRNYLKIAKAFFTPSEQAWIIKQTDPLAGFWQRWTLRESALKLYAKGVWQMRELSVDPDNNQLMLASLPLYSQYQFHLERHLSISSAHPINRVIMQHYPR